MFGQRLKEERARLGVTQPQLAELVGSAKRTVVDWEQKVFPNCQAVNGYAKRWWNRHNLFINWGKNKKHPS